MVVLDLDFTTLAMTSGSEGVLDYFNHTESKDALWTFTGNVGVARICNLLTWQVQDVVFPANLQNKST